MSAVGFEEIEGLIEAYYAGMFTGDGDLLCRVFADDAKLRGFFADTYLESDVESFIARMTRGDSPKTRGESPHLEIVEVRRDDAIATAIVRDTLNGIAFTDHLALIKGQAGWKVVAKIYTTPTALPARS